MSEEILIIISVSLIIFSSPLIAKLLRLPTITVEIILGALPLKTMSISLAAGK